MEIRWHYSVWRLESIFCLTNRKPVSPENKSSENNEPKRNAEQQNKIIRFVCLNARNRNLCLIGRRVDRNLGCSPESAHLVIMSLKRHLVTIKSQAEQRPSEKVKRRCRAKLKCDSLNWRKSRKSLNPPARIGVKKSKRCCSSRVQILWKNKICRKLNTVLHEKGRRSLVFQKSLMISSVDV